MSGTNRNIRILTAVTALAFAATPAADATDIRLREQVVSPASVIRLGDVAEIVSADRAKVRELAAVPLMPAPPSGAERFLRKREVEDLLAAHGHNLQELRIDGAAQVAITTPGTKTNASGATNREAALSAGRISRPNQPSPDEADAPSRQFRSIIESYLNAKTDRPATWRVSCEVAQRHLALLETAIAPPVCRGGSEPWTGRQRFVVSIETAQGMVHVPVYANVQNLSTAVVVAVQPIERGDVITAADVELQNIESVPSVNSRRAAIDQVEKLIGMEARQVIQIGAVIFADQVQRPVMVKRGDLVTVISNGGGIRVRTTARARQDGVHGELLQVESLETRERYDVRVTGPNQAAVFATVRPNQTKPAQRLETAQRPLGRE